MKILLLGEFSAFHKNLKEGLIDLGHDAVVAAYSDGFKKIPADISFDSKSSGFLGKIENRLKPLCKLTLLKDYDVVQLINPFLFNFKFFPRRYFFNRIINNNRKFYLSAAGDDAFFWRYGRANLKYGPFDDFLKYDLRSEKFYMETEEAFNFNYTFLEKVNGVIPIMYEYEVGYKSHPKCLRTIPLPINLDKIEYQDNIVKKKLVVFHGLNRYGFKGTRHVEVAFEYLKKKYPNDLELVIDGKLPLVEYLQLMRRTNVVIDQMYTHSLGMNAVYALAMGKVVMGGVEPESLTSLGIDSSPAINLKPDPQSIIQQIENILESKSVVSQIGYEGRQFAKRVHDHRKVAGQYIETWAVN